MPTEDCAEFLLERGDGQQAWRPLRSELDEEVDVAFGAERSSESRAEQSHAPYAVTLAKLGEPLLIEGEAISPYHDGHSRMG